MTRLLDSDIETKEVLDWKGTHLFHFSGSSCSQKTRIFLALRGIDWESHHMNLPAGENIEPWYMGINPRGLVPTLVIDGEVHIESNDIITELDARAPGPRLIPEEHRGDMAALLHHEDDLHHDLRTLTFAFANGPSAKGNPDHVAKYTEGGSGTVSGTEDASKAREIAYWKAYHDNGGITDEAARAAFQRFRTALDDLNARLEDAPYLLGENLTVLDIAWYVYVFRLIRCTYPVADLHPNVDAWFQRLNARPEFADEVRPPEGALEASRALQEKRAAEGRSLADIVGLG